MKEMDMEGLVEDYGHDGVIRVPGLLSAPQLQEIKAALARYEREILPHVPDKDRVYEADGTSIRNLWRMEQHDEYFGRLAEQPHIRQLVSRLVHGEAVLMAVETFNKPAKTGSGVPWHQDNAYFCYQPPDVLTVWIAIDPSTIENGAVYYAPGSHQNVRPHLPSGVAGNSMGLAQAPDVPLDEQFCGTLEPGDALIHHCQIMHRSEPNRSSQPRLGLLMVFRGAHTQSDHALKANYQAAQAR